MLNRWLLIVDPGRCGLVSLLDLLNRQPATKVSLEEPPLLAWQRPPHGDRIMPERFARWRRHCGPGVLGDAASFYLPYLDDALAAEADVRIIGLRRPREELVASFGRFLDQYNAYSINHWDEYYRRLDELAERQPSGCGSSTCSRRSTAKRGSVPCWTSWATQGLRT
jgi:hypothetical protein